MHPLLYPKSRCQYLQLSLFSSLGHFLSTYHAFLLFIRSSFFLSLCVLMSVRYRQLSWPPCAIGPMEQGRPLYFCPVVCSSIFFLAYSQPSQIGCLPYFHTWCGLSAYLGCRSETCCMRLADNTGRKKSQKFAICVRIAQLCRAISSHLRHLSTIGKKLLNSNISPTSFHNLVNFGPLAAEIGLLVWGTPANFNRFHILALYILQGRRSTEANQTLHDVWPSPGLQRYILGTLAPYGILPGAILTLRLSLALCYIGSVTVWHSSSGRQPNFAALNRGRHGIQQGGHDVGHWPTFLVLFYFLA